jgi:hypothetical protein
VAIAALPDVRTLEVGTFQPEPAELPWPRPALRLVEAGARGPNRWEAPVPHPGSQPAVRSAGTTGRHLGKDVRLRQLRRRRTAAGVAVVGLFALLALPVSALAGRPVAAHPSAAVPVGSTTYVVQPGDTLWSIASRFGHSDPRALVEELAAQTGSETVTPGERIHVP